MSDSSGRRGLRLRALGGLAGVAGAGTLALHAVLLAVRPPGCVGAGCAGGVPHRPSEDLAWMLLAALVLLTFALAVNGRPLRGWWLGAVAALATAVALLAVGMVINGGSSTGSALWWLHDTDTLPRLLVVLGTASAGAAVLRVGEPRWLGASIVAAAVLALPFNIQDWRVLLDLPLAAALGALSVQQLRSVKSVLPRTGRIAYD